MRMSDLPFKTDGQIDLDLLKTLPCYTTIFNGEYEESMIGEIWVNINCIDNDHTNQVTLSFAYTKNSFHSFIAFSEERITDDIYPRRKSTRSRRRRIS